MEVTESKSHILRPEVKTKLSRKLGSNWSRGRQNVLNRSLCYRGILMLWNRSFREHCGKCSLSGKKGEGRGAGSGLKKVNSIMQ